MNKKVYIIGNKSLLLDGISREEYYAAELALVQMGFKVMNPMNKIVINRYSVEESKKKKIKNLMNSDAVFIMPDVELTKNNLELKIAMHFNFTIINSILNLESDTTYSQ